MLKYSLPLSSLIDSKGESTGIFKETLSVTIPVKVKRICLEQPYFAITKENNKSPGTQNLLESISCRGLKSSAICFANSLGSVEPGKLADLVVVKGNPVVDIKTTRHIRYVIKEGVVHDPEVLLRSAEGKIGPVGPDDHKDWELVINPLRTARY